MVGYMSLEKQVDKDFTLACRRALLRRIGTRLRRDAASDGLLLCFDNLRKVPGAVGSISRGMRTVPVGQIGGSVGRCSEFDRDFMPTKASSEERWKQIDRAFYRGEELPAVSLYKAGGFYFILDGHHRVSVASYHGVEWIDAYVTEFCIPSGTQPPVKTTDASDTAEERIIRTRRGLATTAKELSAKRWRRVVTLLGVAVRRIFRRARRRMGESRPARRG